eukprot:303860_1
MDGVNFDTLTSSDYEAMRNQLKEYLVVRHKLMTEEQFNSLPGQSGGPGCFKKGSVVTEIFMIPEAFTETDAIAKILKVAQVIKNDPQFHEAFAAATSQPNAKFDHRSVMVEPGVGVTLPEMKLAPNCTGCNSTGNWSHLSGKCSPQLTPWNIPPMDGYWEIAQVTDPSSLGKDG